MKLTKLFGLLGMACVLTLAACGGQSSKTPGGDDEEESEDEPEESEEDESGVSIESVSLLNKNGKAVIEVKGTDEGTGAKKWSWGLAKSGDFVIGADKDETDFTKGQAYTVDGSKAFTVEWDLSTAMKAVTDFESGLYSIYGGNELSYRDLRINDDSGENVTDTDYKYYVRNDQNQIAIETKLALEFKTAKVVLPTAFPEDYSEDHKGNHVQIIAPLPSGTTLADLQAFEVNGDFQRMTNYTKPSFEAYFWTIENNNAVLNVYIGFMADGEQWMTHLGLNSPAANLFLTDTIDDVEYTIGEWKYAVHSNPAAGQAGGSAEFYGCLGIKVLAAPAPVEEDSSEAAE